MVEKRILAFVTLATIVCAFMATSFAAYYYIEQVRIQEQSNEKQQLLNELTQNYNASIAKRNLLSGDYGVLLGEYQWFMSENYSTLMDKYEQLLFNLHSNYTAVLNKFAELNATYNNLLIEFQALNEQDQVTKDDFGLLLNSFYKLFTALSIRELEGSVGKISEIHVRLCINYTKLSGEPTEEWYNLSFPQGSTLFDLTKEAAEIDYQYYATMEPGHIIISSINNETAWWIWYYWDSTLGGWRWGPVGCDAWILENNGIYKWDIY